MLINNDTHQRETLSEQPIRLPLRYFHTVFWPTLTWVVIVCMYSLLGVLCYVLYHKWFPQNSWTKTSFVECFVDRVEKLKLMHMHLKIHIDIVEAKYHCFPIFCLLTIPWLNLRRIFVLGLNINIGFKNIPLLYCGTTVNQCAVQQRKML